ncbi:MFS transporter [Candidatus Izimaplasma bacterium ZiA1]|uniref:MFS transporter n=1 Tax=Candidatus Izimoplasma sp. ZiA1 TaxID=2024899 RepID=UPI001439FBF3
MQVILTLIFYFLMGLIHNLGHPVTPTLVYNLGIGENYFGIFFAMMSLGLAIGSPIFGILGDSFKKKYLIIIGLLLYSIGQFGFAYFENETAMIFFRLLSGFGVSAAITLLLTHLICNSSKATKARNIAYSAALASIGASISYKIGGSLGDYIINEVFYLQAGLNILFALLIFFTLKEKAVEKLEVKKPTIIDGFKNIRKLNPTLLIFLISLTLISTGAIIISKFLEVYIIAQGYTSKDLGDFVFFTGLVALFTNVVIVPLVIKLKKNMAVMIVIQLLSAIVIFSVFRSNDIIKSLYSLFMIYMVFKALFTPLEQDYISNQANENNYSTIMGIRQLFFSIGMVIGPLIAGYIYDFDKLLVFDFSVLMFILGAILLSIVSLVSHGKIKIKNGN